MKGLIRKLGFAGAVLTGLVSAGCATSDSGNRDTNPYSQTQSYNQEEERKEKQGAALVLGLLGTFAGTGAFPAQDLEHLKMQQSIGAIANTASRQLREELRDEAISNSGVNINLNGNSQPQYSQFEGQVSQQSLIPEYDLERLEDKFDGRETYDSLTALFTYKFNLNDDRFDEFDDYHGITRNFRKGEPVTINTRMQTIRLTKDIFTPQPSYHSECNLMVFKGNKEIKNEKFERDLKPGMESWNIELGENLEPGRYTIELNYSDEKGRREFKKGMFQVLE